MKNDTCTVYMQTKQACNHVISIYKGSEMNLT